MKPIEERATEYACDDGVMPDSYDCESCFNIYGKCTRDAYIAGAKSEHEGLTRWHDPKEELPQRNIDVLVKLRDTYKGDKIHYSVGYINGACWFGDSIGATDDVIGWREIHG